MIPTRLIARNYRCLAELDWSIEEGATAIVGANGSGKSSRLLAIEHCLFGPKSRSFSPLLRRGETELALELEFDHADAHYRIRRGYSARGQGKTWLEVACWSHDQLDWLPCTRETASETQAFIEQLLGISRATYVASAYSPQDQGGAWTEADPAARKRILAEILALGSWDDLLAEASTRRKAVAVEHEKNRAEATAAELAAEMAAGANERLGEARAADLLLAGREEGLQSRLPELQRAAREAHTEAAQASARVEAAKTAKAAADAAREQRDALIGRIDEAHDKLSGVDQAQSIASQLGPRETLLAAAQSEFEAYKQARAEFLVRENAMDRLADEHDHATKAANLAFDAVKVAESTYESTTVADAECPTCHQSIIGDVRAATSARLLADRNAARERYDDLRRTAVAALQAHEAAQAALGADPTATPFDTERIRLLDHDVSESRICSQRVAAAAGWRSQLAAMEQELETLRLTCSDLDIAAGRAAGMAENVAASLDALRTAEEALKTATAEDAEIRRKRISTSTEVARLTAELDQAQKRAEAAEAASARAVELEQSLTILSTLERAYGRDGVPSLIVETVALPAIQTEANRVLDDLASPFRVDLRAQRQTKSGETREALDIIIHTPTGEAPYETLSGGEATRVNVALRIGLARLLASRRGADVGIFAIDEPDGLDQDGADRLAVILKDAARTTFGRVVLVSHQDGLRDALDQTIELTGDQAADRQEVAA